MMSARSERLQAILGEYEREYEALVEAAHWIAETKRNPLTLHTDGVLKAALAVLPAKKRIDEIAEKMKGLIREIVADGEQGNLDLVEIFTIKTVMEAVSRWDARLDDGLGDYQDAKVEAELKMNQ